MFSRGRERERENMLQYGFTPRKLSRIPNFGGNTLKTTTEGIAMKDVNPPPQYKQGPPPLFVPCLNKNPPLDPPPPKKRAESPGPGPAGGRGGRTRIASRAAADGPSSVGGGLNLSGCDLVRGHVSDLELPRLILI